MDQRRIRIWECERIRLPNCKSFYVLKSWGVAWRANLVETLNSISYRSTESDPDVRIKMSTVDNGTSDYKYVLVYVNDVLHLTKDAQEDMLKLNQVYQLKKGFGPPYRYLSATFDRFQLEDGITVWSMTCV